MIKAVLVVIMMWGADVKTINSIPTVYSSVENCEIGKYKTMTNIMKKRVDENPNHPLPDFILAECYEAPGLSDEQGA